jgi:hypothetical protein
MPPQIEPAVPTRLASIGERHVGRKLRVVGTYVSFIFPSPSGVNAACRIIAHDTASDLLMLAERDMSTAILVDASLCIDPAVSLPWLQGGKATIMVTGHLENAEVRVLPARAHNVLMPVG